VSLDSDIPGSATFAKPSEEDARQPNIEDSSMYKVDDADDLLKDQGRGDEIDHSEAKPTYNRPGPRTDKDYNETHYPYRDGIPNRHNAALIEDVVQLYLLRTAHEIVIPSEGQLKVATKIVEIEERLNPKVRLKSHTCLVGVKRVDVTNLRWIFTVDCGNGPKMVRLKATRKGNVTALAKMDVSFSCSCKAWRWLGPEYHAKQDHYLDGKPAGTASTPDIKDPTRVNRVCKHVAAVISHSRKWSIPTRKRGK
jgi:hypothetical protein